MTPEKFALRLTRDCLVAPGSHVLVALSGGADSVALLRLMCEAAPELGLRVSCAHVEHGIRGDASREDEAFVRALCEERGVALCVANVDAPGLARERGCGLEEAARALRYDFFERTADALGADCVALAHHALDQAETVLLRAARGSDVRGLCAMRERRGRYVRPLLGSTPGELRAYLVSIGQCWREDETNADVKYARTRVRRLVIPELERACPGAPDALARLARAAQRDEDYFDARLRALNLPEPLPLVDGLAMPRGPIEPLHPALMSRALVRLIEQSGLPAQGADAVEAVCAALSGGREARVNLTHGAHAHAGKRYLCIIRDEEPPRDVPLLPARAEGWADISLPLDVPTPFGLFRVRAASPGETGDGKLTQVMPSRLLSGAAVGSRRAGDRMRPFGAAGHVPLKKLMADAGVERAMRKSVPILRGGEGILWAVTLRPGEACRIKPGEDALCVEYMGPGVAE